MRSLKSRKLSLGVLAALVLVDWLVGMQAFDGNSSRIEGAPNAGGTTQPLPTLRIVQLPTSLASQKLHHFAGVGNHVMPFQEAQTLPFTVPMQIGLAQLSGHDAGQPVLQMAQENAHIPMVTDDVHTSSNVTLNADADEPGKVRTATTPTPTTTAAATRRDMPHPDNLIKLLAFYSMLHR